MKRYLLVTVYLLLTKFSWANTPHLYALHINGINTTRMEARLNYEALEKSVQVDSNMVIFNVIWNPTGDDVGKDTLSNLNDVIRQKAQEQQAIMTLDDFTDFYIAQYPLVYPPTVYHRGTQEYARLENEIPDLYYQELNKIAGVNFSTLIDEFHNIVPPPFAGAVELLNENPNIHNNRKDYPKTINLSVLPLFKNSKGLEGQVLSLDYSKSLDYILLIPHSQGNLYANRLYDYLVQNEKLSPQHIAIYGIATPASENKGDWIANLITKSTLYGKDTDSYITSYNDFVINATRNLFMPPVFPPILPANIMIPFYGSVEWGNGHNLINVYLKDNVSKQQVGKMVHLELFAFSNLMAENLKDNNFLLSIYNQEFGGGLVGPTGVVCLDSVCDPRISYFSADEFEVNSIQMDAPLISLVPIEYFPEGQYFSIQPYKGVYGLHAQTNYRLSITYSYVRTDYTTNPPHDYPFWDTTIGEFTCEGVDPNYYYLYPTSQFWNGRFIAERAMVY